MKIILTCTFCILILISSGQDHKISIGQDYKISTSRISVHATTVVVPPKTVEGQQTHSIFIADSVRFYDENSELIDSLIFNKKVNSGEFTSVVSFDQERSIMTYSIKKMPKPELVWVDKTIPNFNFKDIEGKTWNQNSIKGKVVIFHFWFTKCGPCIKEFSLLNEFKKNNPNALWFAISFEDSLTVKSFLRKHKLSLVVVPDQKNLADQLNVKLYPKTFIIDKNSKIKEVLYGPYQDSTLLQSKLNFYYDH